jgi:hypothetical protein
VYLPGAATAAEEGQGVRCMISIFLFWARGDREGALGLKHCWHFPTSSSVLQCSSVAAVGQLSRHPDDPRCVGLQHVISPQAPNQGLQLIMVSYWYRHCTAL